MSRFSPVGFVVGLILALLLVSIAPELLAFNHDRLVYGLVAILLWLWLSFNWAWRAGARL
jgi:hypothetical protein